MIKRFIFTEKSVRLLELYNKYVLDVNSNVTKLQIKLMIEKTFLVRVKRVNTFLLRRVNRKSIYTTKLCKRAFVSLADREKIKQY